MPYLRNANNLFSQIGRLQIGAFAVDVGMPAMNATIRIMQRGNRAGRERGQIIEEMISDISGMTPVINLPAPPVEFSMHPSDNKPYATYDVSVSMDGYEDVYVEGVQILPNTTAFQGVSLMPVTGYTHQESAEVIEIADHTLWGDFPAKIPEADIKPMPPATGLVVLPEPVVPEFIIVHDGRPENASAPVYWVPFKDYIKNVASSEIYATWPAETIKANVIAIISFALNRIYTEWYRGKGYDFMITTSTAFDQAYVHGRNFFDEISEVVDEIFNTFVTRPNIRQPLLTQYCDGRRVNCPTWMSQWGSKTLGDQGYNSVDILKRYYGHDIFLMHAQKVEGVPMSYGGIPLETGFEGEDVRTIQEQLLRISTNFPAIPKVNTDGVFGEETRKAVEKFQDIFRIPATGIVDFATWYRISNIYVSVTRMAEVK